jgi:hypothetical protein
VTRHQFVDCEKGDSRGSCQSVIVGGMLRSNNMWARRLVALAKTLHRAGGLGSIPTDSTKIIQRFGKGL